MAAIKAPPRPAASCSASGDARSSRLPAQVSRARPARPLWPRGRRTSGARRSRGDGLAKRGSGGDPGGHLGRGLGERPAHGFSEEGAQWQGGPGRSEGGGCALAAGVQGRGTGSGIPPRASRTPGEATPGRGAEGREAPAFQTRWGSKGVAAPGAAGPRRGSHPGLLPPRLTKALRSSRK